ncbi:MAG: PAS domain S-box protein [Phycisphaerae bacterium]
MIANERFFEALCRTVGFALISADRALVVRSWNEQAERLLGRTPSEAIGSPLLEAFPEAVRAQVEGEARRILAGGRANDVEYEYVDRDGNPRVLVAIISPILADDGSVLGVSTATRDITVRRHAVRALRESTARIRAILDNAVEGIFTLDERGTIETFNPAAERIFGWRDAEVIGRHLRMLLGEPYRSETESLVERYVRTGERNLVGRAQELPGIRKSGDPFPLELTISEVPLGERRIFTAIVRDMTERKRLTEQVARADLLAGMGRMANAVAHHFNNILGGILASTGAALASDNPRLIRKTLEKVDESIGRAARITSQLLAFGRSENAVGSAVDLGDAVRGFVERLRDPAERRGVTLVSELAPVPQVKFESHRVLPVLDALSQNALDAMSAGGQLRVVLRAEGSQAVIRIEDTGPGMPPEVLRQVFQPFFTTKGRLSGGSADHVGLGLAAVHGLVERMGGTIEVNSKVGAGTQVEIRLPLSAEASDRDDLPRS